MSRKETNLNTLLRVSPKLQFQVKAKTINLVTVYKIRKRR